VPGCPDAESLAAYLDGQLFPEQRERLEEHAAACDGCATALADAIRFQGAEVQEVEEPPVVGPKTGLWGRRWVAAAAAVAMLAVPAAAWFARSDWQPWRRDPRAPLIAATAQERPMLPRLTGGFRWAQTTETYRAVSSLPDRVPWGYYAAAETVRKAAVENPSADRLGALADAHLLAGDLDRALVTLARATARGPDDPRLRSDLAAAYLARGQRQGNAADLATALEIASGALAAQPSLLEAQFNRALALEGLHLYAAARQAWQGYLTDETDPQWAAEASRHLRDLGEPLIGPVAWADVLRRAAEAGDRTLPALVAAHRFTARRLVERELLPEWSQAVSAGDRAGAAKALATASAIARLHATQTGEPRLEKQVMEAKAATGNAARRLASAHQALAAGEWAIDTERPGAREELVRAAASFAVNSVGWRRATVELLVVDFATNSRGDGLAADLERRAALGDDDLLTRARLVWLQGLVAAHRAELGKAISHYLDALASFERMGEVEPAAWLHFLLSEIYTVAGDERSTWRHLAAAIAAAPTLEERRRSFGVLIGAAMWSVFGGRPWLADAFLDELTARRYASLPLHQPHLHLWRARVSLLLNDRHAGASELAQAALATRSLESSNWRRLLAAELAATRGATAASPAQSIAALSRALDAFSGTKPRLPGLLLQRSLAHRNAGDIGAAERDLRAGIALLEDIALREQLPGLSRNRQEAWLTRLDGAHALYDQMIAIELARDRDDQAFLWSERARRRALAVHTGRTRALEPVAPARVARELDVATTLLSYALIGDQALLWQVDSRGTRLVRLSASAHQLASWARMLDADLAAGEWTARSEEVAQRLHQALITPATLARGTSRLVIIPDKTLATVPFSALIDEDGTFLVEGYAVEVAPSAALYLHARERWRSLAGERPSALVLGAPRADEKLFPGLASLPGAADEARRVAQLYPEGLLMIGEHATRDALIGEISKHPIVHLATHALVDETSSSASALALSARRPGDGTGALFADEISSLVLPRTRTVVLASCGSSVGPLGHSEGRLSLPRAFLSADVPTVVAALWPVGDRRSVELLTGLHTRLRAGDDPATALRSAQLRLLASGDQRLRSPATWALFQALGG
jgi:CHAT domain-containing protein